MISRDKAIRKVHKVNKAKSKYQAKEARADINHKIKYYCSYGDFEMIFDFDVYSSLSESEKEKIIKELTDKGYEVKKFHNSSTAIKISWSEF